MTLERERPNFKPEQLLEFFERLMPQPHGLKTFEHPNGLDIMLSRHPESPKGEGYFMAAIKKQFGKAREYGPGRFHFEVDVDEVIFIYPKSNTLTRRTSAWVDSFIGGGTILCPQREDYDKVVDLSQMDERTHKLIQNLMKLIQESKRVHPYTGKELPFDEGTEIDRYMSGTLSAIDNFGKQVGGLLKEGVKDINVDVSIPEYPSDE